MPNDDCLKCLTKSKRIKDLEFRVDDLGFQLQKQKDIAMSAVGYEQMAIDVLVEVGIDFIPETVDNKEKYGIEGFYRCRACHERWSEKDKPKHKEDCRLDEVVVQSSKS